MSTTVHTQSTGSTPPAHQAKPKAQDKPAADAAPGDLFASLLALIGQAPALADLPTDSTAGLATDGSAQGDASGTDQRGLPLLGATLAGNTLAGTTLGQALPTAPVDRNARPGIALDGFTAVQAHDTLPAAALEATPASAPEAGKRSGHAPAFAWRNAPGAAQPAPSTAAPFGAAQAPMNWQRVQTMGGDAQQPLPGALTAPRATVALDERFASQFHRATEGIASQPLAAGFGLGENSADTALGLAPAGSATRQGSDGLSAAAPGTVVAGASDANGLGNSSGDANSPQGQASPDQADPQQAQGLADEPTEIGHWGTGALRHASLRVGEDAATAIDIQLKVQGQQVDVNFATDNPETRDALREQATAALSELLQQSGLGLGGVSVGTQGQPRHSSGDASGGSGQGPSTVQLGQARRAGQGAEAAAPARPRTDDNRPLDVFA